MAARVPTKLLADIFETATDVASYVEGMDAAAFDWRGMSGLRDIVAHQYHRLDTARLWPVITEEFPELIAAVEAELGIPDPKP
jgi:uncharacterized protein with HEPN domain